jgi:hypothetical protein
MTVNSNVNVDMPNRIILHDDLNSFLPVWNVYYVLNSKHYQCTLLMIKINKAMYDNGKQ